MPETSMRLDGNAAAGDLQQLFAVDVTTVIAGCSSCGRSEPLGRYHVYASAPGTVVRCPHCEEVVLCLVQTPSRTVVDVGGLARLTVSRLH